jgi:hypothetical protein
MPFNPFDDPPWLKQMKALEDIINPPWLKQMEAIINPPWLKQMKALEDIINPPWLKQMEAIINPPSLKQMKAFDNIVHPPWAKLGEPSWMLKQMNAVAAVVNPTRMNERFGAKWLGPERAFVSAAQLAATISPMAPPVRIRDALASVAASLTGQAAFALGQGSPSMFQLSTEALSTLTTLEVPEDERGEFPNPHAALVAAVVSVRQAVEAGNGSLARLEERLRVVVDDLKARPDSSGRAEKLAVWSFVLTLIATVVSFAQVHYAHQGEERAQRQESYNQTHPKEGREKALPEMESASIPNLVPSAKDESPLTCSAERIVIRAVNLRVSRKARSRTVRVLRPGDLVTVVEDSGQSARVTYRDHLRETELSGWVAKKYLARTPE